MANDDGAAARRFHQATKHSLESLEREPHVLDWENLPLPFKIYHGLPALELPISRVPSGVSAPDAITGRASRARAGELPDRGALARLLHFSLGILRRRQLGDGRWHNFRAAPCTGALYHIDAYLITADLLDSRRACTTSARTIRRCDDCTKVTNGPSQLPPRAATPPSPGLPSRSCWHRRTGETPGSIAAARTGTCSGTAAR